MPAKTSVSRTMDHTAGVPGTQSTETSQEASDTTFPNITRTSSIRFSESTNGPSRASMASGRVVSSPDEITPIRHAQALGSYERNYQTSERSPAATSSADRTAKTPPVPKPTGSGSDTSTPDGSRWGNWYKRIVDRYGAVSLDNKGSVARDHLALERTFLAWLRTSLAFASIGIAITQLFRLNTSLASRSSALQIGNDLPFAPFMGHSVPVELLPYLQHIVAASVPSDQASILGPTLLDQLLLLPPAASIASVDQEVSRPSLTTVPATKIRHLGKPLGSTFIGISIIVLLVGFHRYFESQYWIIRGKFPASRGSIALVGTIAGALIVASLVVVVVVEPTQYEKK